MEMAERDMDFRMERPGLVDVGQHVTMTESVLKTLRIYSSGCLCLSESPCRSDS